MSAFLSGRRLVVAGALGLTLVFASSAHAGDLCLQYAGASCELSDDLGFFRFLGAKLPRSAKKAIHLHGRACGAGVATGSAVVDSSETSIRLAATFVCGDVVGVIDATLDPADTALGSVHGGRASFFGYDLDSDCSVTIVDCADEPGLPAP
jgi:hypothetical protein